jgi:integrase/recombinase XerD
MLDALFQRSHHIRRLRANPLGAIIDPFADQPLRRGYTTSFVHQLPRAVEHYGHWLGRTIPPSRQTM